VATIAAVVTPGEPALIVRARGGDGAAFEALLAPRLESLYRTAAAIMGNDADARDATQDACVSAWKHLPRLRDLDSFDAWLGKVLVNSCRMLLRRQRRVREIAMPVDFDTMGPRGTGPESVDDADLVARAFDSIDPDARALLVLHHFQHEPLARFQEIVELHVEAINRALVGIPADRVRLHVCWGNYDGPHVHDVPLEAILPILYRAKVGALSLELANPRHAHEWKVIKQHPLPDSMLFLPGVIDSTTNFVEHPEVVADRICQVVDAVGDRSRVIASVDCGFGTFAGSDMVADSVVWAKLGTLAEGARLASRRLWS
jgi:RNA polymerase sigma factor (sigma-70 family)